jgi:glutathione peroxidase
LGRYDVSMDRRLAALLYGLLLAGIGSAVVLNLENDGVSAMNVYEFNAKSIKGADTPLSTYKGSVLLIVNVASQCGFTPQYEALEKLYRKYKDRGFAILGFPSNQFGGQEPGSDSEIATFCQSNYGVTFPMFAKVDVNGSNAHPLYRFLAKAKPGLFGTKRIKWNFTKFLVDRQGHVIKRFAPQEKPESFDSEIEAAVR